MEEGALVCLSSAGTWKMFRGDGKVCEVKCKEILTETLLEAAKDMRLIQRFTLKDTATANMEWLR